MENLGRVTMVAIMLTAGFMVSLLGSHIILSIANLYKLGFITGFSFAQVYGILFIINIVKHKRDKDKKEKTFSDLMKETLSGVIDTIVFLLLEWGIAFLVHGIIV